MWDWTWDTWRVALRELGMIAGVLGAVLLALDRVTNKLAPQLREKLWRPIRSRITTRKDVVRTMNANHDEFRDMLRSQDVKLLEIQDQRNPESIKALGFKVELLNDYVTLNMRKLQMAMEHSPIAVAWLDPMGHLREANQAFRQIFCSNDSEDLKGAGWQSCLADDMAQLVVSRFDKAIDGKTRLRQPCSVMCKGVERRIEIRLHPEMESGRVIGWRMDAVTVENP